MRAAVLTLTIVLALFLAHSHAWAFDCFETPEGKRRCACIGADDCSEMRQSGSCKSDLSAIMLSSAPLFAVARRCGPQDASWHVCLR